MNSFYANVMEDERSYRHGLAHPMREDTVEARNKKEAGIKAAEAVRSQSDSSSAKVETKVLRIEKTNDD